MFGYITSASGPLPIYWNYGSVTKEATANNLYIGVYLDHYMQRALIFDMYYHLVDLY